MNVNRRIYLSCTRPVMYLCELPLIILLALAIYFNDSAATLLKLYPLIITTAALIIFIFIFFWRVIAISAEDVKIYGRFTSRDRAIINKGKTLTLTLRSRDRLKVEVYEDDSKLPELDFLKNDPSYKSAGLNLFRETARCSERKIAGILKYFGIKKEDVDKILSSDTYSASYPSFNVTASLGDEEFKVSLEFTETV